MARQGSNEYQRLHQWMRKHYPLAGRCEECGATDRRTERACVRPTKDPADWRELCWPCHQAFDGHPWASAGGRAMAGKTKSAQHRARIAAGVKAYWQRKRSEA